VEHGPGVLPFHYKTRRFRGLLVVLFPAAQASSSLHCIADQETWSTVVGNESWTHGVLTSVKGKNKKKKEFDYQM